MLSQELLVGVKYTWKRRWRASHLSTITPDKKMSVVAQSFESDPKTAKGPNDLVVTKNGTCYFTDPNGYYGDSAPGTVYYVTPGGKTSVLSTTVVGPNGIALSGDEKT